MKKNALIEATKNGPYLVKGIEDFRNSRGELFRPLEQMALCRCGKSGTKPYCNGTHAKIGFDDSKKPGRVQDKTDNYKGKEFTIHDNRGVCSHTGYCTSHQPNVFRLKKEPWIDVNAMPAEDTKKVIRMCPSGALSYSSAKDNWKDSERETKIRIKKNGPYEVEGKPKFKTSENHVPESKEHFCLCRCGESKNKPFCDGTHWQVKFKDEKN